MIRRRGIGRAADKRVRIVKQCRQAIKEDLKETEQLQQWRRGQLDGCLRSSSEGENKMLKTCQCNKFFCRLIAQFDEVSKLLRPVMLNMAMTLIAWIYVYEMKTDDRLSAMFLMSGNATTGNEYKDGLVSDFQSLNPGPNIFAVLAPIGPLRKVQEKAGDYSHSVLRFLMFTADANSIVEVAEEKQSSAEEESTAESMTEDDVEQEVEEPQLRRRVRQSAGSDLVEIIENVLKEEERVENDETKENMRIKNKTSDPSSDDDVAVEMELDTSDNDTKFSDEKYPIDDNEALSLDRHKKVLESTSSSSSSSSSSPSGSNSSSDSLDLTTMEDKDENVEGNSVTAADALNDASSLRLGMGDFVFYSVLVGQAATSGSVGATTAAALGVVYGLLITLTCFSNGDETTPALPISIVLGTGFHFSYLFLEPPLMYYTDLIFHHLLYAIGH
ncbi:unnamed protein product [Angiostrongylus costaricensis]|uniref:MMPL domain-containing protein n=1 Tax=Angiostrongylus costaricensis TaxID=334426 RepID=A0A0R3PY14_ANGCS|nr:unnamed protein product [Angiostrongylus costaricensis]